MKVIKEILSKSLTPLTVGRTLNVDLLNQIREEVSIAMEEVGLSGKSKSIVVNGQSITVTVAGEEVYKSPIIHA